MKKRDATNDEEVPAIETIQILLHDINQKLDYLIKNLHRFNGPHDPCHSNLNEFLD